MHESAGMSSQVTPDLTPEQIKWLEIAEAAGRITWLISVLREAKGEQYLQRRKYRVRPEDFRGNAYVEHLARVAGWNEMDPR
jgi:hypothetical protein